MSAPRREPIRIEGPAPRVCGNCYKPLAPTVKLFCDAACEAAWVARL